MRFDLGIQTWKIMFFRSGPSSCMQFSILRLKLSIAWANSCWSIVSTSCRMASSNSFKLRSLWVYTDPSSTLRGRNHMMTSQEALGPWYVAETRNDVSREHVSKNVHWCVRGGAIQLKINMKNASILLPVSSVHLFSIFLLLTTPSIIFPPVNVTDKLK
jgi:hypothetical protein